MCDGFCSLLNVMQQMQGYQLLSEMKEMVVHRRDLSRTSSVMGRWVPRMGACWGSVGEREDTVSKKV